MNECIHYAHDYCTHTLLTLLRNPLKPTSGGGSGVESDGVATSSNAAYELIKCATTAKEEEHEYELVGRKCPPKAPPLMCRERNGEAPFTWHVNQ